MSLLPPPEAIYPDPDTAQIAIQLHAKQHGYAFYRISPKPSRVLFACDRAVDSKGKDPAVDKSKQRQRTGSKKGGCLMRVELRLDNLSSQWMLYILQGRITTALLQLLLPILYTG
jgi:hypothetical protein